MVSDSWRIRTLEVINLEVSFLRRDFSVEGFVAESERLESQLRPFTNDSFDYKFVGCNTDTADGAVAGGYPCALWQLVWGFRILAS